MGSELVTYTLKDAVGLAKKRGVKRITRYRQAGIYSREWVDIDDYEISIEDAIASDWIVEEKDKFNRHDVIAAIREATRLSRKGLRTQDIIEQALKEAEERGLGEEDDDESDFA